MKTAWIDRSPLAKAATFFAILFICSAGLCGANLALFSRYGAVSGPEMPNGQSERSLVLIMTAFIELAGMAIGAIGLGCLALIAAGRAIHKGLTASKSRKEK